MPDLTHPHRNVFREPVPVLAEPITELMRKAGSFVCDSDGSIGKPGKTDDNFQLHDEMVSAIEVASTTQASPGSGFLSEL